MEEENKTESPAEPQKEPLLAGKFKSVDALLHAYRELEAEFTRRSQQLKALEEQTRKGEEAPAPAEKMNAAVPEKGHSEEPNEETSAEENAATPTPCAETQAEHGPRRVSLEQEQGAFVLPQRGVPLMGTGGAGVIAPHRRPASIAEAGDLALGYIKRSRP